MSAPVIIDCLMDAILRQSTIPDNKQSVEQNGSEIRERMNEKLEALGKRRNFELSSDNVTDENLKKIAVSPENLSNGKTSRKRKKRTKRVEEKDTVVDERQSIVPLIMEEGSTNLAEGNATEKRNKKRKRKKAKVNDEVQILGQNNMDTGSTAKEIVTLEKSRFKDDVQSMGLTQMDERSRENLAKGNVNIEKPISKDEGRTAEQTSMGAGSTVNLSERNATLTNKKIQEEVQSMDGCRMEMGSTEKNSDNGTGKRKKKHKRKGKNKDEVQGEMNVRSIENLVEGDVTFEKPKTKDGVKTIGQFNNESGSAENSVEVDVNVEKPRIKDEVQNLDQIRMVSGSTAEGSVTIRVTKTQDEVQSMDQTNMDTRPLENVADGQGSKKRKKKRKNKANIKDEFQREMDTRSTEDLAEENATVEKPKIRDEILGAGQTKIDTGSSVNLTEGDLTTKDEKVQEEVETMDQTKMDTGGPTENSTEGNVSGKRKKKRRSKVQWNDEVQSNIDTRSTKNPAQGNATMEKPKIKDEVQSIGQSKMGTGSADNLTIKDQKVLDEVQSMAQTKMNTGPTENSAERNVTGKRKKKRKSKAKDNNGVHSNIDTRSTKDLAQGNEIIEMPKTKDDVQRISQTKTDTGSTENSALGGNVITKNPNIQDEVQYINHPKIDTRPTESSAEGAVTGERKKKRKSKVKFDDDVQRQRDTSLTENLALGNATVSLTKIYPGSIDIPAERNLSIKNPEIQDEAQRMDQIKMDMGPSENFAEGNVTGGTKRKLKSKAGVQHEAQSDMHTGPTENLAEGNMTTEKPKIEDEVQSGGRTTLDTESSVNPAEGNVTIKNSKIQDEAHSMHQTKMDMRLKKDSAEGNVTAKRKKQRKKAKTEDEIPSEMDTRSTENLAEGNASIKKPEIEAEVQIVGLTKMDTGSRENFAKGNASIKVPEIDDEVQSMGLTKMGTGSKENLSEGRVTIENPKITEVKNVEKTKVEKGPIGDFTEANVSGGRKRKRKSRRKKAKFEDEFPSAFQGGSTSNLNCELHIDGKLRGDCINNCGALHRPMELESKLIPSESLHTCHPQHLAEQKEESENGLSKVCNEIILDKGKDYADGTSAITTCEVQSMGLTKMDIGSKGNLAEGRVTIENPKITEVKNVEKTKVEKGPIGDFTEANVSGGRKRKRKSRRKKAKSEDGFSSAYQGGSTSNLNCELHIDGKLRGDCINNCGALHRPMELESKLIPSESLHTCHPQHLAEQKEESENGLIKVCNEIILDKGKDYADGASAITTCEVRVTTKDACPQTAPITSIRRKLLVLDVNGLLADIIYEGANQSSGGFRMYGRTVYKRPFCDDFLKFCFQNFDVGIWSSRSKKIIDKVVSYLLGDQRDKLLFCWDMDHCTQTGLKTLENKHKPLVCKELRKIWENANPNLPWKKGDYDESNTLLLDDSPYKALLNPLHTAIFPDSYQYDNKNDHSLGPGGALRVYLEWLLTSDNVQKYVEKHPLGQRPITEENSSWEFYSRVLQEKTSISNPLKVKTPMSNPPLEDKTPTPIHALS